MYQLFKTHIAKFQTWRLTVILFCLLGLAEYKIEQQYFKQQLENLAEELTSVGILTENRMNQVNYGDFLFQQYTEQAYQSDSTIHNTVADKVKFYFSSKCLLIDGPLINNDSADASVDSITLLDQLPVNTQLRLLSYCLAINGLADLRYDFSFIEKDLFFVVKVFQPHSMKRKDSEHIDENTSPWLIFTRLAPLNNLAEENAVLRQVGKEEYPNITTNIIVHDDLIKNIDSFFPFNSFTKLYTNLTVEQPTIFEAYTKNIPLLIKNAQLNKQWLIQQAVIRFMLYFLLAIAIDQVYRYFKSSFEMKRKLYDCGFCVIEQGITDSDIQIGQSNFFNKKETKEAEVSFLNKHYRRETRLKDAAFCSIQLLNREYTFIVTSTTLQNTLNNKQTALLVHDTQIAETIAGYQKIYKYDQLTGLPNRNEIEELVSELQTEQRIYLFALSDLDHFKLLNDEFGHQFGDLVLQSYSEFLKNNFKLKKHDRLIRIGGEEFLIIIELKTTDDFDKVAESIARRLNSFNNKRTSASTGMTIWHTDQCGFDQVYPKADTLLYQAKKSGRSRVCYQDSKDDRHFYTNGSSKTD